MKKYHDMKPASGITARHLLCWCIALCLSIGLAGYAFQHIDVPLAHILQNKAPQVQSLAGGLAGRLLISGETVVILMIAFARQIHGHLPKIIGVLAIACLTSICAYALNSLVLKVLFGVPNPADVLISGAIHTFHFFQGTNMSSFPSGHMMLAGGFGGVFMYIYPKTRIFLGILLAFGMFLLVIGGWHYVSDVIIGTFSGVTAGLLAGEVWALHLADIPGADTSGTDSFRM